MARYQLRHPVRAAQFDGANAGKVFDLINLGGGGSMMSDRKQLKAYTWRSTVVRCWARSDSGWLLWPKTYRFSMTPTFNSSSSKPSRPRWFRP